MIPFTQYVRGLAGDDDLVRLDGPFEVPVDVLAAEALRRVGRRFGSSDPQDDLVSGVFSGPDQTQHREARPWSTTGARPRTEPDDTHVSAVTIRTLGPTGGNRSRHRATVEDDIDARTCSSGGRPEVAE
ncbi:hypothetical protein C8039_19865 [Halogeometricum sp. wsp3]|nr:hypothetical protein C8039_19865 [Halogeometricum sp. wsp3]